MPEWIHLSWIGAIVYPLASGIAITAVLRGRKEPATMLAWILLILLLPLLGILLYVAFGGDRVQLRAVRKMRRIERRVGKRRTEDRARRVRGQPVEGLELPEDLAAIERMCRSLSGIPAVGGNEVRLHLEADETYAALEEAIRTADDHVHLEFYIWKPDETGRHFRDLLVERARAGVEVRLLLDSVGSWSIGRRFLRPLRQAGARVAFFLPLFRFERTWTPHLRNHRKLAVIDGHTGFMGSQNVGDEYRGWRRRFSPWYDSQVRIRGPAARYLQQTFAEDWLFASGEALEGSRYFPKLPPRGSSIVQILPTGPDQDLGVLGQVLFSAVSGARDSVHFATPYFVPDSGLRMAMIHAAVRGVNVELVVSCRNDAPIAIWAGRSFYRELMAAGVEIHEFDAGVLHAKLVTVDDRWSMLGSANMDVRSFRLNFELTALVYDEALTRTLGETIRSFSARARAVTNAEIEHAGLRTQVFEGLARLFTPML